MKNVLTLIVNNKLILSFLNVSMKLKLIVISLLMMHKRIVIKNVTKIQSVDIFAKRGVVNAIQMNNMDYVKKSVCRIQFVDTNVKICVSNIVLLVLKNVIQNVLILIQNAHKIVEMFASYAKSLVRISVFIFNAQKSALNLVIDYLAMNLVIRN